MRLAIDIGGTKFTVAAFEGERMVRREQLPTDRAAGREKLLGDLGPLLARWRGEAEFEACGIGFGGPVVFDRQVVDKSTHAPGWEHFDLPGWVRGIVGDVPVVMDNDANAGALGEYLYGAGKGCSPLFYMTVSTGIGGGIVWGGRLERGPDFGTGEIGHMNVRPDGPDCICGSNGCLERMCCGLWMERDYGATARELMMRPEFVEGWCADMARALKACIMILNPERIVMGGGIAKAGDALFVPLRRELGRQMPGWSRARVDLVGAGLGDDSVLWGALGLLGRGK